MHETCMQAQPCLLHFSADLLLDAILYAVQELVKFDYNKMGTAVEQPVTYSLKFQSRALAAVQLNKLVSTWVVATNALREENEIRFMQYDPDHERLVCSKALVHAPEVWDVCACPTAQDLLLTVWSQGGNYGASLWSTAGNDAVQRITDLQGHTSTVRRAMWHPTQVQLAITLEENGLHSWDISDSGANSTASAKAGDLLQLWSCTMHPQNTTVCATVGGNNIQLWDLRSMSMGGEIVSAHRMPARDVCFSPTTEHRLVSCGDDCKVRVWDTRSLGKAEPLLELGGHTHWVWKAQFSPFHEQLIAAASSDCLVNLYHSPGLATTTAAGAGTNGTADTAGIKTTTAAGQPRGADLDGKVKSYDEHEDSVYGLAWSTADPWLFASLSYDGRVVVNKVPTNTKYKIMV